jgi:hypothetical protein
LLVVVRRDDRIGAMPFRLGRQRVNEQPAEQAADGRHDQEQPRPQRAAGLGEQVLLAVRVHRSVAGQHSQAVVKDHLAGRVEDNRADAGDDADQQRESQ